MAIAHAFAYRLTRAVLGFAVNVYFRRIEVRHSERVPKRGALLIACNHPAGFTDVIVLAGSISRRIHFLAMSGLFEPWIRGVGMRLVGALPVYRREDDRALMARNVETFRACHEILDQGGAVLIFPEGKSESDRRLADMKTGAARLAIAQEERPGQAGHLTLLPAGLHFSDRTTFRSDVVLTFGEPVPLAPFRPGAADSRQEDMVERLTDTLQSALEQLFLHIPEPDVAELVHDLERIYVDEWKAGDDPEAQLDLGRGISECVDYFRRTDPERMFRLWRKVSVYRRQVEVRRLDEAGIRELRSSATAIREATVAAVLAGLGVFPAAVGYVVHYLPYKASAGVARLTSDPAEITQLRIVAGVIFFPLAYAVLAFALRAAAHWPWRGVLAAVLLAAGLGLFTLAYLRWARQHLGRIRLAFLTLRHRPLIMRLISQRRSLIRAFDAIRADFRLYDAANKVS